MPFFVEILEGVESTAHSQTKEPISNLNDWKCLIGLAALLLLIAIAIMYFFPITKEDYHPTSWSSAMSTSSQSGSETETTWNHSALNMYVSFLNETYQQRKFPEYHKSSTFSNKPNHFIDLAIVLKERETDKKKKDHTLKKLHGQVESLKQNRISLNISDIGKIGQRNARHILIEGAPGAGKTPLAWHLCRLWGSGKLLQHWSVVIMIQIRHPGFRMQRTFMT